MSAVGIRERLGKRRRQAVKRHGKRLIRSLAGYLARHSEIPDTPVIDPAHFPWARDLRSDWKAVRAELDAFLAHRERLPRCQDISPDQSRIAPDDGWHTIVLYGFGHRCRAVCERCPETARLLDRVPHVQTALFSILAPGRRIPLHRGITKGVVRCHLGLAVPRRAGRCGMIVGGERVGWAEGDVIFFDDTYPHAVWNDTDEERAVLLLDFERPLDRRGRLVARLLMAGLRRTGYFRDAYRNQRAWEARYLQSVASSRASGSAPAPR